MDNSFAICKLGTDKMVFVGVFLHDGRYRYDFHMILVVYKYRQIQIKYLEILLLGIILYVDLEQTKAAAAKRSVMLNGVQETNLVHATLNKMSDKIRPVL